VRLQVHKGFTFDAAAAQVDNFAWLGVSHAYASADHHGDLRLYAGYDTVDYTKAASKACDASSRSSARIKRD
jgi:(1->4)-alpha-D-glucan 1-alpha-D-glucosylmutase